VVEQMSHIFRSFRADSFSSNGVYNIHKHPITTSSRFKDRIEDEDEDEQCCLSKDI